jgi:ubiquinone/menaquinone biosynthesis C-methylase UbiE
MVRIFVLQRQRFMATMSGGDKMSEGKPRGAGKSSFDLINQVRFFKILDLTATSVLLDLGSGRGNYALAIAERIGTKGKVYAFDAWAEGIGEIKTRAMERGLQNVEAKVADIREGIPLADKSVDTCLMATVLHDFIQDDLGERALSESARMLKPGGRLVVVEFKKMEGPPGPPINIRLAPEEVEAVIRPFGFKKARMENVGPYHYLVLAALQGSTLCY